MKNLSISSVTKNFVLLITIAYNTLNTNKSSLFYKDMKSKGNPMFEVKFGTSEPVFYNEYWVVNGEVFEIEIDASFAGRCEVSEYDIDRYADKEAVDSAIKEKATEIILKCLNEDWPEKTQKAQTNFMGLEELFDMELEKHGIKGCCNFLIKALTPESEEMCKTLEGSALSPVWNTPCPPVELFDKSLKEWIEKKS